MDHVFTIGKTLSISDIDKCIRNKLNIKLSDEATIRISVCRQYLENKLKESDAPYYGINTGFGSLCDLKIDHKDVAQLQKNLVESHACGMGDKIDPQISRLILLLKIQNMAMGHSGVTLELVNRMVDLYNNGHVPEIYELGSLGASGDLAPLAHLGLGIIDRGFELSEKEGLAILNGTQFSLAFALKVVIDGLKLWNVYQQIAALSLDAFRCQTDAFDENIQTVRPHPGQELAAKGIRELRNDSSIAQLPKMNVQDPYSFRCIPQVHGASYDALNHAKSILEVEMNSVTDNPLIFPVKDMIISGGNFHAQPLALGLDYVCIAIAEMANISERRIYQLINGDRGLPQFLVKKAGLNSGFMITQYTAASIVSQNKQWCTPASVDSIVSCKGQEDHVSMAANAGSKCLKVLENAKRVAALEILNACQALDFRRPDCSSSALEAIHEAFRSKVKFYETDRIMKNDLVLAEAFIEDMIQKAEV